MKHFHTAKRRLRATLTARFVVLAAALAVALTTIPSGSRLQAQQSAGISPQALAQIGALMAEKAARTPVQRKISSDLLYAAKMARGEAIAQGVPTLDITLPDVNARGAVLDVRAQVSQTLLDQLVGLGADVVDVSARYENIRLRVDLGQVEALAALPQVVFVQPKQEAMTSRIDLPAGARPLSGVERVHGLKARKRNDRAGIIASLQNALGQDGPIANVGSRNSEGDAKHKADSARSIYGVSGAGVKVGVLSDGVTNLAASQMLGDLGTVNVLPGQAGMGDEGTAMLEIVHDLAPNAQLYFATAFNGIASFAQNIRDLRTAGCDIIVDDVGYFAETPFQDGQTASSPTNGGIVIQAVKDVTAAGALYFSSAANSGNKNDGTSGTWEGDFVDGGAATGPLTGFGNVHDFGGQNFDVLSAATDNPITLHWADPLGASSNDYDIYRLDSTGSAILAASTGFQTGTQDPFEFMPGSAAAGQRVVIVRFAGAARFLHLATNRGRLSISTAGETHGHSATSAPNSFGVAATSAQVNGLNPFNTSHVVETFSSDGPRRIFFGGNGAAITPGNFTSTGGLVLQKPDITAADGVSVTGVGGFPSTFYGTSAAAPHAAAIAALVKSKNLAQTATQIRTALLTAPIDIEGAGVDRDAGYGIIMADSAVAVAPVPTPPTITMQPANQSVAKGQTASFTLAASGLPAPTYQWQISTNAGRSWTNLTNVPPFSGVTTATLTVANVTLALNQTRYRCVATNSLGSATSQAAILTVLVLRGGDFDSDGKADLALFRPSTGFWYIKQSSTSYATFLSYQWGISTDVPVTGDYDGDGVSDVAVYRPTTGVWFILQSSTNFTTFIAHQWGIGTDLTAPGDYDGDGKTDLGVYRRATGTWYIKLSSTGYTTFVQYQWGITTDKVVPGDYDGDGRTDLGVYRPSSGFWFILQSSTNFTTFLAQQWGIATDITAAGDYDGDGKTDLGLYRVATGTWFVNLSSTNYATFLSYQWGISTDVPAPGDYDGDGKGDLAVFRPSNGFWFILRSSSAFTTFIAEQWGTSTDVPVLKSP